MTSVKMIVLLGFALMFAAGLTVGRSGRTNASAHQSRSWLGNELNLTSEQQQQMRKIWSRALAGQPDIRQFRELDRQRELAIRELLSDDQQSEMDQIIHDHDVQVAALVAQRDRALHKAQSESRAILTDDQRVKFDQILKAHARRRGGQMVRLRSRKPSRPPTETGRPD